MLSGAGGIGIGPDQLCPLLHQRNRFDDRLIAVGAGLSDHDIVGIDVIHRIPRILQGVDKPGLSDDVR